MGKRVFITGIGIISALGNNIVENRNRLKSGESGIHEAKILDSRYTKLYPFGEIPHTDEALKEIAGIKEDGVSRTESLAVIAINQAIEDAQLVKKDFDTFDFSLISASTVGGMSKTDLLHSDANMLKPPSAFLASYNVGEHTSNLLKRFGVKGYTSTFNTACSSSANAIMLGTKLIKSGRAKSAIVGGTDALAKFTVNGFNALQILSDELCKPFDKNRKGLNLGEGAAYLVLEDEDLVGDKKIYGEVTGYGNANDAFHASSMSEEATGIVGAIKGALESAGLSSDAIGYINAHGTGTENNDITEQTGLHKLFKQVPPFQSTKTYTGHTLAAAGAIEAVFSLLAMNNSELYPSLNCNEPIDDYSLTPIKEYQTNCEINHVVSNSFGFGGNCSSLILSKV